MWKNKSRCYSKSFAKIQNIFNNKTKKGEKLQWFVGLGFKKNGRTYQDFEEFASNKKRRYIIQIPLDKKAFKYEWAEPKDAYTSDKPSYEWLERFDESIINTESIEDVKPVGRDAFGNIYNQFKGKAKAAIDFLLRKKEGKVVGALHHKDIGDIDLWYGNDKAGLKKIAKKHPEVLKNLQSLINAMELFHVT